MIEQTENGKMARLRALNMTRRVLGWNASLVRTMFVNELSLSGDELDMAIASFRVIMLDMEEEKKKLVDDLASSVDRTDFGG